MMASIFIEPHERFEAIQVYRDRLTDKQVEQIEEAPDGALINLRFGIGERGILAQRCEQAAARLTSLSGDNERMAKALEPFVEYMDDYDKRKGTGNFVGVPIELLRAARSAIAEISPPQGELGCYDCHRPYSDGGFPDLVIPDEAWAQISPKPGGGGVLCPSCICKRLHDKGIKCEGKFTSGPLAPQGDSKPVAWAFEWADKDEKDIIWRPDVATVKPVSDKDLSYRNITPLYAHPPSDSIDECIKELPEGWEYVGIYNNDQVDAPDFRVTIESQTDIIVGTGPDPLSAIRAAVSRINPERKKG